MVSNYDNSSGKIFVGGIPPSITQSDVQKYFGNFGEVTDCVLMQDKVTGKSRGFGFVTFKDSSIIEKVLKEDHKFDGKTVDCKRAIPRESNHEGSQEENTGNGKTKKIFVGGLPQNTTDEEFRGYFDKFGKIDDSVIMVDKETGKSRGFGFVTFDTEEAVEKVIESYQDNKIGGKWIECKKAFPRVGTNTTNKRGSVGGKSRYSRDSDQSRPPSSYGGYGYGSKEDPYYSSYGADSGYYPKTAYPGYQQPQDYYDERGAGGYWSGGAAGYNPQYYGAQGYTGYGATPDPRGGYGATTMDSHAGMMQGYMSGYGAGPHAGGYSGQTMPSQYIGGDYPSINPQNIPKTNPGGPNETVGGPIKSTSMAPSDRYYKPY